MRFSLHQLEKEILPIVSRLASHRASRAFTLVELIMVIGIISVVMGMGSLAFVSINKGANLRNAQMQVKASTYLARERAITSRQRIVFMVPTAVNSQNPYVQSNMLYRSIVLFAEETPGVGFVGSVAGKIEQLPDGVVFSNCFAGAGSATWTNFVFLQTNGTQLFEGKGFRYAPTGTIYYRDVDSSSSPYRMILTEGDVSFTGALTYRPNANTYTAEVRTATGRCTFP